MIRSGWEATPPEKNLPKESRCASPPRRCPEGNRSTELAEAYSQGQSDIIDALEAMNTLAPNFGVVEGLGQDLAVREMEWLVPELNRIRKKGVGPTDFRRVAAQRGRG